MFLRLSAMKPGLIFSVVALLFSVKLSSQVIYNNGAHVTLSAGSVVFSRDIENNTGTVSNNGTLTLTNNLVNSAIIGGDGLYNLKGNWNDNGTFNPGRSNVIFEGTLADQVINHGSSGESFYNLTLKNPLNVYQVSTMGGSLNILNDLQLIAGTLLLHQTTTFLTVNNAATITGNLIYNGFTTQTTTIGGDLTGTGKIDMGTADRAHILNLAGAVNQIGTFLSGLGPSLVNYNGSGNQTVFGATNYRRLIISIGGIKTLQGNSKVNIDLNITGGTFDLGTVPTSLEVFGSTTVAGSLKFNGTSVKTVNLFGNLTGTGSVDMSGGNLAHKMNLNGATNSIGSYSSGTGSTVTYTLNGSQSVFASNDYRNLTVTGSDLKTLLGDVNAKGILTMAGGNINAADYILEVSNPALSAINRTTGTVIGKLRRAVGTTSGEYLYPIGSASSYNPLKITFHSLNNGPLTAQFKPEPIGTTGLPIDDNGNEIHDTYTTGYWSLSSVNPMSSGSFSLKLNYNGFTGVDPSASIIKRTNGGNFTVDGQHGGIAGVEISRNILEKGISTTTTDFAIGRGRPRIVRQPEHKDICETVGPFFSDTYFEVYARGRGTLTYQWEVSIDGGSTFTPLSNGGVYSDVTKEKLIISGAPLSMNGYWYRCVITDGQLHPNTTNKVLLTVNKIPVATSTTPAPECPGVAFETMMLGTENSVTGTTFAWSRTDPAGIITNLGLTGIAYGDQIPGTFNNTTDAPISIVFTIIPTGPATTHCEGSAIYRTVTVNPTPKVFAILPNTTQCDNTATDILLTSPSSFTSGAVTFRYNVTVTDAANITGFITPSPLNIPDDHHITDVLVNHTNTFHTVIYRIIPQSPVGCADGQAINAKVTVEPTPKVDPLNDLPAICYDGTTRIVLTTPTTMTTGSVVFDYTVSSTGGGVVTGNMNSVDDAPNGHTIARTYRNSSHDLQSVTYRIIPVNNSTCPPGPAVESTVEVHAIPIWDILQLKPLTCDGGAGLGTIKAILSTGADPYHIVWNGPDNYHNHDEFEISNLSSGAYYATATDNLGCTGNFTSYLVPQYAEPYIFAFTKTPGGYNISCIDGTDGKIRIAVSSGITAPYRYSLKKGSEVIGAGVFNNLTDFAEFENLGAGTYTLSIIDKYDCERIKSVTLRPPQPMSVTFGKQRYSGGFNVSCRGYNDGAAWVETIGGGRGSYTYRWYTVNGSIPGTVNGNRIDNITAGTYYLEVTDALGCQKVFETEITQPEGMELKAFTLSSSRDKTYNVSCSGGNDGSIDITIQGGSGTYNTRWTSTDGFTSDQEDITGLKAGTYTCTVTDNNGCVLTPVPSFTLTQPAPLQISTVSSVSADGGYQVNCNGGTGSVNVTVSGGSSNIYSYNWTTSDGSGIIAGDQNQSSLKAGTYHLEVTDYNNCIATKDIPLAEPPALSLNLVPKHITCEVPGFSNGSIDLSVTGGAGQVSYLWSTGATTRNISGLTAGEYTVDVTYNNTCTVRGSAKINLPAPLTYNASYSNFNSYEVSCFGMSDGEIHIAPTSGKAPFTYSWTGPGGFTSSSADLSGLKAGMYNLRITDSNLCTTTEAIEMRQPGELQARFIISQSLSGGFSLNCAGDSTGSIIVNPQNSVNNVNYLWSDGFTGRNRANLRAGDYTVVITDDNNCQAVGKASITQPDSIKLSFEIKPPFCPDMPDGEIRLNVTGGVPGAEYMYKWSDNSTRNTLTNISMGEFKVRIEDLNRCFVKDSIQVVPQNEACLSVPNIMSPNGDLINDYLNIGMKELYPQMEVTIFNRWGETVWKSAKGYPDPWDGRSNGVILPIDSYHYIINLHNGSKPIIGNVTIVK